MRSTFAGLNTMVRGIMANQLSLDTTGHNITNAGTEGYSRQVVTLATTNAEQRPSAHGHVMVGSGVDALAVNRARDVYADIQYRNENPTQQYYKTLSVNYDKLETIFDDSRNLGMEEIINKFYQTWVNLSTTASNSASRTQVIEQGRELSDHIQSATVELQEQIRSEYEDLTTELKQIDDILENLSYFNKQIVTQEVTGAQANDLRDKRDALVDQLSDYLNINVSEMEGGAYQINSGGVTLVNGITRSHLVISNGVSSSVYGVDYGVTDYNIKIQESNIVFTPQNGILKARFDAIAEDKGYIDKLANISSFLLSTFNDQHKQGWDLEGHSTTNSNGDTVPDTINFFGQGKLSYQYRYDPESKANYLYKYDTNSPDNGELLSGVQIIAALEVNTKFSENRGDRYLAAATSKQQNANGEWENMAWGNRTGDGTNAVYMSELFNISMETIISDNKANAEVYKNALLRNKAGEFIDDDGNVVSEDKAKHATAMSKLSINAYYQQSMSYLGVNSYSVDVNYEAIQNVMTQVQNWRDSTAGVDWNEELTNMIKFQKGFVSCSRCLNAMDEILDRLVNSTGVVGR
jgi:flagellar hook-associated protein 1 FlgK